MQCDVDLNGKPFPSYLGRQTGRHAGEVEEVCLRTSPALVTFFFSLPVTIRPSLCSQQASPAIEAASTSKSAAVRDDLRDAGLEEPPREDRKNQRHGYYDG